MSQKTSPARRAAFLRVLGETGNHTIAATHAKVSRSWVTLHKATDPEFRAACDAAVARAVVAAEAMRAAGDTATPAKKWRYLDGHETTIRGGNGRRAVVSRARLKAWTPRTEAIFLETLAASCNVKLSCKAAGLSVPSAYMRRAKWPGFGERWKAALENGYVRLEFALVENACNTLSGDVDFAPDAPMPPVTPEQAIRMLRMYRYEMHRMGKRPGLTMRPSDPGKARAEIIRMAEIVKRASKAGLV